MRLVSQGDNEQDEVVPVTLNCTVRECMQINQEDYYDKVTEKGSIHALVTDI